MAEEVNERTENRIEEPATAEETPAAEAATEPAAEAAAEPAAEPEQAVAAEETTTESGSEPAEGAEPTAEAEPEPAEPVAPAAEETKAPAAVEPEAPAAEAPAPQKRKSRAWLYVLLVALIVLFGSYLAGYSYAGQKFLPNTYINGIEVSGCQPEEVNRMLVGEGPKLTVIQREKGGKGKVEETIDLFTELGATMRYDVDAILARQDRQLWFMSLFEDTHFDKGEAVSSLDEQALHRREDKMYFMQRGNYVEASNARLKLDGSTVLVVPAVEGSAIHPDEAKAAMEEAITRALRGEGSQTVDLEPFYDTPTLREGDPDLAALKEKLERTLAKKVTLVMREKDPEKPDEKTEEFLEGETQLALLTLDGNELAVDEELLTAYVKELADSYFICRYEYVEEEKLADQLRKALLSDQDETVTAEWYINYPTPGSHGNGAPSFIEVSINQQHLWYYEYGKEILSTAVVTGSPHPTAKGARSTITGYLGVNYMARDVRLKGDDYDVKVKYWIGIDPSGYFGIHDASWRGSFGGDIYLYDGSHGCINVPEYIMADLYRYTDYNTEVFVYY